MQKTKVNIDNRQKEVKLPSGIRMLVRRCCIAVLRQEGFTHPAEVNVMFVDDTEIMALNSQHRKIHAPTDVLSFPMGQNGEYDTNPESGMKILGDIVISVPRAVRQANDYNHSLHRELAFLTAHSMLHLLGYDHEDEGLEAVRMREKEEQVLVQLGHPRSGSYVLD